MPCIHEPDIQSKHANQNELVYNLLKIMKLMIKTVKIK